MKHQREVHSSLEFNFQQFILDCTTIVLYNGALDELEIGLAVPVHMYNVCEALLKKWKAKATRCKNIALK